MSLQSRLSSLISAIGADVKSLQDQITEINEAKFTQLYGDGAETVFTVTHNLGVEAVDISVYGPTSGYEVLTVTLDSNDQATVTFDVAPPLDSVRVVVIA